MEDTTTDIDYDRHAIDRENITRRIYNWRKMKPRQEDTTKDLRVVFDK